MNIFHQCKNGQQRPGSREDCQRCTPAKRKPDQTSQTIMRLAHENAELKARIAELEKYIDDHNAEVLK